MAILSPDREDPRTTFDETLLRYNPDNGEIKVISEIKDMEKGKAVEVDALGNNKPAFFNADQSNIIQTFISAYRAEQEKNLQGTDKKVSTQWFRPQKSDVPQLSEALRAKFNNSATAEQKKFISQNYVDYFSLDNVKIDKHSFPLPELAAMGIHARDLEPHLKTLEAGRAAYPFTANYQIGERGHIRDQNIALQFYKNSHGEVHYNAITPAAVPELQLPEFKQLFSSDDEKELMAGKTLSRLIDRENPNTQVREPHYVAFDKNINRLVFQPSSEVKVPDFLYGRRVTDVQKEELKYGREIFIEKGKNYGAEFSGTVRWDINRGDFIVANEKYTLPNIPKYLNDQLTSDQIAQLKDYRVIDAKGIKDMYGNEMYGGLRINPETNKVQRVPKALMEQLKQAHSQTQNSPAQNTAPQPAEQEQQQTQQTPAMNPAEEQGQGQSRGRKR